MGRFCKGETIIEYTCKLRQQAVANKGDDPSKVCAYTDLVAQLPIDRDVTYTRNELDGVIAALQKVDCGCINRPKALALAKAKRSALN